MKWIKNLNSLYNDDSLGECPYCGGTNIKSNFQKVSGEMGYGDIWCDNCKNAFHISRSKVDDKLVNKNYEKPKELKY